MDKVDAAARSRNMAKIRSKDTAPELLVRRLLHSRGWRYRLHAKDLPGRPDIVFRSLRAAILVHGCFWHCHPRAECQDSRLPKSNTAYWTPKLQRNVERDERAQQALAAQGWRVLVVWECELRDERALLARLESFLAETPPTGRRASHIASS